MAPTGPIPHPAEGRTLDLAAYFARIGYEGAAEPTLETLRALHRLHPRAIAFENLSPFLGEEVPLAPEALEEKLVRRKRGGYCFEQNLLFAAALEEIGFPLRRLAARVRWNVPPEVTTARSHMLLVVGVEGSDYLCDVGFGGLTQTAPLAFVPGVEQPTDHETFRVAGAADSYRLEANVAGEWQRLYLFDLQEQLLPDYEVSNWYLSHHPASQFVTGLMVARASAERRFTLRNVRYAIHHRDGKTERRHVADASELRSLLQEVFGIALPAAPDLDARLQRLVEASRA